LGTVLLDQNQSDEAITTFRKAIELIPKSNEEAYADAYTGLGKALMQQNKLQEAIKAFEDALAISPNFAKAQKNLQQATKLLQQSATE
jgi:superkiller protein 3